MNSPARDIAKYLAANGVGAILSTTKWAINYNGEMIAPPDTITIYDTGGGFPDTDDLDIDEVSFQVRVRAVNVNEGWSKHREIRDLLIFPTPVYCATSTFSLIVQTSDFGTIGTDEGGRHILTASYRGRRTESEVS